MMIMITVLAVRHPVEACEVRAPPRVSLTIHTTQQRVRSHSPRTFVVDVIVEALENIVEDALATCIL